MRIALVTDSNAQLPPELIDRYGIAVVPLTVVIDGVEYAEGVDLDADEFYARFDAGSAMGGRQPSVATSQPGPGRFAAAYGAAAQAGAQAILSIHIDSAISGTLNSARMAAATAPIPVRLVDSGTTSFGIACCVWEAAEALRRGANIEDAAAIASEVGAVVRNVFVVRALELAAAGGRVVLGETAGGTAGGAATSGAGNGDAIPVVSLVGRDLQVVGRASDVAEAAALMADFVTSGAEHLRVAVGVADRASEPLCRALEQHLDGHPAVKELVRYRIGPSVGAHTGPGIAGVFFYPPSR